MVARSIAGVIRRYKKVLKDAGFPACRMYLFGSYAKNEARKDSDIDVCLVSAAFEKRKNSYRKRAALIAFEIDPRIEVVAATPQQFHRDKLSPLFSRIRNEAIAA